MADPRQLRRMYETGLELRTLTTHVQLKLMGSPPVQRGTARTQELPNHTDAYNSRANQ